ncbi:MAG: hypothetical protein NDP13_05275 [Crenarchaeota archaeon]|nr:hypothetical protein [Thermoproteota archaeon]MCR8455498.1 hypothetical protein [Thermoproteota archaeon]
MDRLEFFDLLWLDYLRGGIDKLKVSPYVGPTELEFMKEIPVKFKWHESKPNIASKPGTVKVLYALHYGEYIKLGSSVAPRTVCRMYSQSPIAGMAIAALVVTDPNVSFESLEEDLANRLSSLLGFEVTTKRKNAMALVKYLVSNEIDYKRVLDELKRVVETSWGLLWVIGGSFTPTTRPLFEYWFTTPIDECLEEMRRIVENGTFGDLQELKQKLEKGRTLRGTLTILPNALCVLSVKLRNSVGNYVAYGDTVSYNLLIEVGA